jgi:mRNA-degrading endonuclease RelE of RelBE toxin-antitoxin system
LPILVKRREKEETGTRHFGRSVFGGDVILDLDGRLAVARIQTIMARQKPYTLAFASAASEHLRAIDAKYHALIREKIGEQLRFEPASETTNRKPLRQPALFSATWEIRFGPNNRFRVLYDIDEENRTVQIIAIGEKQRDRLFIGGEEVEL